MTMTEIRKSFKNQIETSRRFNNEIIEEYITSMLNTFEDLYKNGTTVDFDDEFLRFANGFQTTSGEYENLTILQTFDLHRINATKKVVKEMMIRFIEN